MAIGAFIVRFGNSQPFLALSEPRGIGKILGGAVIVVRGSAADVHRRPLAIWRNVSHACTVLRTIARNDA